MKMDTEAMSSSKDYLYYFFSSNKLGQQCSSQWDKRQWIGWAIAGNYKQFAQRWTATIQSASTTSTVLEATISHPKPWWLTAASPLVLALSTS